MNRRGRAASDGVRRLTLTLKHLSGVVTCRRKAVGRRAQKIDVRRSQWSDNRHTDLISSVFGQLRPSLFSQSVTRRHARTSSAGTALRSGLGGLSAQDRRHRGQIIGAARALSSRPRGAGERRRPSPELSQGLPAPTNFNPTPLSESPPRTAKQARGEHTIIIHACLAILPGFLLS